MSATGQKPSAIPHGHGIVKCDCGLVSLRKCGCHDEVVETVSACRVCRHQIIPKKVLADLAQEVADRLKKGA